MHWTDASVPTLQHQVETLGPKSGERAITGTGADLRKLSMEDSKRQLMSMGMSEEEVARESAPPFCQKALPIPPERDCTVAGASNACFRTLGSPWAGQKRRLHVRRPAALPFCVRIARPLV